MTIKKIFFLSIFACNLANAQITVDKNFGLELVEKDSGKSLKIEKALNAFLTEAQENNYSSKYVDSLHLKKYEFFFNKLASIGKNSSNFHNPTVLKSFTPDGVNYRLTVGFYGIEDEKPFIYQITELNAEPYKDHYRFYSPFEENTATFKTEQIKNVTYRFSGELDVKKANEFAQFKDELPVLTKTEKSNLEYFSFQSLDELLKSYGFLYSARQCNFLCYDLGFTDNDGQVFMTGTNNENYIFGYYR